MPPLTPGSHELLGKDTDAAAAQVVRGELEFLPLELTALHRRRIHQQSTYEGEVVLAICHFRWHGEEELTIAPARTPLTPHRGYLPREKGHYFQGFWQFEARMAVGYVGKLRGCV
jgi:hypothetical protein